MSGNEAERGKRTGRQKKSPRRHQWRLALAMILLFAATFAPRAMAQSTYPERPVRMVVAFAPGGITDIIARLLSEKLSGAMGQNFYVDNKGGAAGALGAKIVSTADADGYTLLVTTTAIAIRAAAISSEVNPRTQLTPIALLASAPTLFAVKTPTPAKNLMEFVRTRAGGQLTYSSAGTGTTEHLTAAYVFKQVPGLTAAHIPFRSGGEAVNAVLGGHVDVAVTPSASGLALIQEKKLQPLAVASHKRVAMFPDVPTLAEAGMADVENSSWIALFGPPDLPKVVVETLSAHVQQAMQQAALRQRLAELGFDLPSISQPNLVDYMGKEVAKWGDILKVTGVRLE
jgi:tripartite-type tricarboxylate transporter receptor subunit TctC